MFDMLTPKYIGPSITIWTIGKWLISLLLMIASYWTGHQRGVGNGQAEIITTFSKPGIHFFHFERNLYRIRVDKPQKQLDLEELSREFEEVEHSS